MSARTDVGWGCRPGSHVSTAREEQRGREVLARSWTASGSSVWDSRAVPLLLASPAPRGAEV